MFGRDVIAREPVGPALASLLHALIEPNRVLAFRASGTEAKSVERLGSPLALRLHPFLVSGSREKVSDPEGVTALRSRIWRFLLTDDSIDVLATYATGLWTFPSGERLEDLAVAHGSTAYLVSSTHEREAWVWWTSDARRLALRDASLRDCIIGG